MDLLENGTYGDSTASIYVGQSLVPHGMLVSLQSSLGGKRLATKINLALLLNGPERAREEFLLQAATSTVVLDILSMVHSADRAPDPLMIPDGSLLLLLLMKHRRKCCGKWLLYIQFCAK
ncbi:UNVERIFIED_CONTAM: hypothetical protein K2H54_050099 [Gekko kuhli]